MLPYENPIEIEREKKDTFMRNAPVSISFTDQISNGLSDLVLLLLLMIFLSSIELVSRSTSHVVVFIQNR